MVLQDSEGVEAQEVAYQHIKKSVQSVQSLSRYHGLRAALSMLAHQVHDSSCKTAVAAGAQSLC